MIALCRVILNLRQSDPALSSSTSTESQARSARFIGNIGESLQIGEEEMEGDVALDPPPVDVLDTPDAVLDEDKETGAVPPV